MKIKQVLALLLLVVVCFGMVVSPNICVAQSFDEVLSVANSGNAEAIGQLALMYCEGKGVKQNYTEALKWAQKGVELGNPDAMYVLGYLYNHGHCVKTDAKKAYEWYLKAAEQGNAAAMNNIGLMYYDGGLFGKDYDKAAKWFVRAINLDYDSAYQNLTNMRSRTITFSYRQKYDEEFDRTLAKNLSKKTRDKNLKTIDTEEGQSKAATRIDSEIFDAIGFDVSDKVRSNDGYLIISKVKSGDMAEKLGVLIGSDLYQVDNMNMKQCNASELKSYIKKQAESKATVLVIFMGEDGAPKKIDITLK